jgi:F0F1-type ATP synthase membrane subunit a
MNNKNTAILAVIAIAVVVAVALLMQQPKDDSLGGRLNSAMEKVSEGVKDAGKELKPESQKSFGEKVGDAVEDAGKGIKGTK